MIISSLFHKIFKNPHKKTMSMQLQQNLFSIYRLFLKLPRYVLLTCLAFFMLVAVSQLINMKNNDKVFDVSQCMLDYLVQKHELRKEKENKQKLNGTAEANGTNSQIQKNIAQGNMTNNQTQNITGNDTQKITVQPYQFMDVNTVLNVEIGGSDSCSFNLDYDYSYNSGSHASLIIAKNEKLVYLKSKSKQYLKKHNIKYDLLTFPKLDIQKPWFSYFYDQQMLQNEVLLESIRTSIYILDTRLALYLIEHNQTIVKPPMNELYASFYFSSDTVIHQHSINLIKFVSLNIFSHVLLKIIFLFALVIVLLMFSIFVGLFIRYSVFFVYSIFLVGYDKCMAESWGWTHLYLAILWNRFRSNQASTLKFFIFYVISAIGMYGLFAFGCYCIIVKIIFPFMPLPINLYSQFFFKTIFFIQLFHYIFCRSRTSLRFFPILSYVICHTFMLLSHIQVYKNVMIFLNLNFTFQMILFIVFLLIEQAIQNQGEKGLIGQYCPSLSKPRMLFYAGYDISWQKTMPPIWTYFTNWFDYSYFNESQRSLLEKDYQLLYGRMLGLNERQEIPEYQEEEEIQERAGLVDQPSNQMNLIQNQVQEP